MKIVVDTNILFIAILNSNSRIGKLLFNSKNHFQFFTCSYLKVELQRHRNKLLKITKLSDRELLELINLVTDKITFIDERLVPKDLLRKCEELLLSIDPDDSFFVALALHLDGKLWTGDKKLLAGLKSKKIKLAIQTSELSLLLDDLESI